MTSRSSAPPPWVFVAVAVLCLGLWVLTRGKHSSSQLRRAGIFPCARPDEWWGQVQQQLRSEVEAATQGLEVVFYGDSLIEGLRGTSRGMTCPRARCEGIPEVFQRHVRSKYRAAALGIAGDQTTHLMWRLSRGGELPRGPPPKLVVLLVGTNDIGSVSDMGEKAMLREADLTVQRMQHILELLQSRLSSTQIALLALFPRGTPDPPSWYAGCACCLQPDIQPNGSSSGDTSHGRGPGRRLARQPRGPPDLELPSMFSSALERVNKGYRALAAQTRGVAYIDCANPLLERKKRSHREINPELMPDALHPGAAGYELLFKECWDKEFARLAGASP